MITDDKNYISTIKNILKNSSEIKMAIAYWGNGSQYLIEDCLKDNTDKKIQIICNLTSGGTNPNVIRKINELKNVEIKHLKNLHAKFILTDKELLVGSANMSTNGLGLENNECPNLLEMGILTTNKEEIKEASDKFNSLLDLAKEIKDIDLVEAETKWNLRQFVYQIVKPKNIKSSPKIDSITPSINEINLLVYRSNLSDEAKQIFEETKETFKKDKVNNKSKSKFVNIKSLDCYENWEDNEGVFHNSNNLIIPIYFGLRGKIVIYDLQKPIPDLEQNFKNEDGTENKLYFTGVLQNNASPELSLLLKDVKKEKIQEWLDQDFLKEKMEEETALCVPLTDFLNFVKNTK